MQYPARILPQPNFKKIQNIHLLHNFHLIHFTETKDNRDENDGKARPHSIVLVTDNLRDFSNSLLGTFEVDDIYLEVVKGEFKTYFSADWEEGSTIDPIPHHGKDFIVNNKRGFFFLAISDCNGHEVTYSDGSNVNPVCRVLHTPTNGNFWHMSLRWFHNGQDISELEEKQRRRSEVKRVLTAAKAFIQEKATFEIPTYQSVDTFLYT
jgi:hypothetical protein